MFCYVAKDERALRRVLVFLWLIFMVAVMIGGVGRGDLARLELEGVAGNFANPNRIAYIGGVLMVSSLFWILRSSIAARPLIWAMAGSLFVVILMTVSRGGILAAGVGGMMFISAILLGRGVRLSGIVRVMVLVLGLSQVTFLFSDSVLTLQHRIVTEGTDTPRTRVYSLDTLGDLKETLLIGWGTDKDDHWRKSAAGLEAHNTFLYMHMAFGGIAAWIFLVWQAVLGVRVLRMFFAPRLSVSRKFEILAMYLMVMVAQILSNLAFMYISSVYATAWIEKYTAPFSARRIRERRSAEYLLRQVNAGR
jgi:hypothetical protein